MKPTPIRMYFIQVQYTCYFTKNSFLFLIYKVQSGAILCKRFYLKICLVALTLPSYLTVVTHDYYNYIHVRNFRHFVYLPLHITTA